MTVATLRLVMAVLADRMTHVTDVAHRLGLNRTTLYRYVDGRYVDGDGTSPWADCPGREREGLGAHMVMRLAYQACAGAQ